MSSTSDRDGYCDRCGCANGKHAFGRCRGKDKKGSKWERCKVEWARCTIGGHSDLTDAQYIDCFRCPNHPGGNPEHFWGTQPDDKPQVPTADQLGIPYPGELVEQTMDPYEEGPSNPGHVRTFSSETVSTDPLHWDPERIEQETSALSQLARDFDSVQIDDNTEYSIISSEGSKYVDTYYSKHQRRVCFCLSDDEEVRTKEAEWVPAQVDYEGTLVPCLLYTNESGQFYTWEHGAGEEGGSSKSKDKRKGKDRGNSEGKEKRKDKKGKGRK